MLTSASTKSRTCCTACSKKTASWSRDETQLSTPEDLYLGSAKEETRNKTFNRSLGAWSLYQGYLGCGQGTACNPHAVGVSGVFFLENRCRCLVFKWWWTSRSAVLRVRLRPSINPASLRTELSLCFPFFYYLYIFPLFFCCLFPFKTWVNFLFLLSIWHGGTYDSTDLSTTRWVFHWFRINLPLPAFAGPSDCGKPTSASACLACRPAFVVMLHIAWVRTQRAGANPGGPPLLDHGCSVGLWLVG